MSETRPSCPACNGVGIYGLTHQHRTTCPRYLAETATIAADHQRGAGIRDTTDTELHTIREQDYEQPESNYDFFVRFEHSGGFHHREPLIGPSDAEPRADGLYWWGAGFIPAERTGGPRTGH